MSVQIVSRMRHTSGRYHINSKYIGGIWGSDETSIFSPRILQPASLGDRSTQTIVRDCGTSYKEKARKFSAPSMPLQLVSRMRHASGRNHMNSKCIGGGWGSDKSS
ncbi:hypothetical protein E2320_014454, partial [Naja naja]